MTTTSRLQAALLPVLLVLLVAGVAAGDARGATKAHATTQDKGIVPTAWAAMAPATKNGTGPSARALARAATTRTTLADAVQQVTKSTAARYNAVDDHGAPLDGLKVVQVGGTNVGVYHTPTGNNQFDVQVATSADLMNWQRRATLDTAASQPTIAALPGGAFLVAYEKDFVLDILPRALRASLTALTFPLDRIRLRFRYYHSLDDLLANRPARQFTPLRQLSPTAEGTPNIITATLHRGLISQSRIEVGLHTFTDTNGDGQPDVDRRAVAVLTNFDDWQERAAPEIDDLFLHAKQLHAGMSAPPRGAIGDRDDVILNGVRLELHEAQYIPDDYSTWRIFLLDPFARGPMPLEIHTNGGSHSFGNPTVTSLTSPSGRPALFISMFVFNQGAAPGEGGPLIYYRER